MPRWAVLILAFGLGLTIDIFSNTGGIHAFATVLAAFLRPVVINLFTSIEEGNNPTPSFHTFGVSAFVKYVVIIVFIHHITLFFLEAFSFAHFWLILFKAIVSSIVTILMILGIQSLTKK
jgi:rod shape-determining protein MreD